MTLNKPLRRRTLALIFGAGGIAMLAACGHLQPDPQAALRQAELASGANQVKTLRFAASGTGATFGQAFNAGQAWPRLNYSSLVRVYDYENAAMREESARSRAEPQGGGAVPLMGQGEQRQVALVRGAYAWNMVGPAPAAAPVALDNRLHELWTSPHGVIKAAAKNRATARTENGKTVLSFVEPGRFKASVWLAEGGLVERVESVQPSPVLGDTPTVTRYSEWREVGPGVKFPGRIVQEQGGHPVLDLRVAEVQLNAPAGIEVPALVASFSERVVAERAAEGVWFLTGGSHNSVLIELRDALMLVEAPLYDGRAQAVIAEARRLAPGKPLRWVVNSHHHFDHAGGLRAAAAEGATLVVSEAARPWYERAFATPNAVNPDAFARSGRSASFVGVDGRRVFTDGQRNVEVLHIAGGPHAQGFQMVWLPRERLLIQGDAYTPAAPGVAPPATPNANQVTLVENIERLRLDVDRILPLHGRVVPLSELYTSIGRPR